MKLPNFRVYSTQATTSLVLGICGLLCLSVLSVFVLHGLKTDMWTIPYNAEEGYGVFRKPVVYACTAVALVIGMASAAIGFISLGQKRNARQGHSWLGLAFGAFTVAVAPVLFLTWEWLSEPAILVKQAGG